MGSDKGGEVFGVSRKLNLVVGRAKVKGGENAGTIQHAHHLVDVGKRVAIGNQIRIQRSCPHTT